MSGRIDPCRPLAEEIRRLLGEEIGKAIASLETARSEPDRGVHETRKRFKKIRALLSLVRAADRTFHATENARYRDLSQSLAGAREATALVETVDRFLHEFAREAAGLAGLRERLAARRPGPGDQKLAWTIDKAIATCEAGAAAAARFDAPAGSKAAADVLASGAKKALRRAGAALVTAAAEGRAEDFHELRKAVKAHAAHLSFLADIWGSGKRREAADRLGTALGDLNDLAVIGDLIEKEEEPLGTEKEIAALLKLIRRKKKSLTADTLAAARALLDERPNDVGRRLAKAYREAASVQVGAPELAEAG